jgi:hypothetical protein
MADGGGGEEGSASALRGSARRRGAVQPAGLDADELLTLMHGSDPVKVELNRLENEVRGELMIPGWYSFNSIYRLLGILRANAYVFFSFGFR